MQGDLASFPLPILTFLLSAVACGLMLTLDLGPRWATRFFAAFFAVLSIGALMVGLRFGYGVERLVPIQRSLPLLAGPLLYLGFACFTTSSASLHRLAALHIGAALMIGLVAPMFLDDLLDLDLVVAGSYLFYAVLLARIWRSGPNGLRHARFGSVLYLRNWCLVAILALVVFALADTAIALSFAAQRSGDAMALISAGALVMAVGLLAAIVSMSSARHQRGDRTPEPDAAADPDAAEVEKTVRAFLMDSQLYLDTELTVDRLAKRLHMPARSLSAAINQSRNMNVSQYVNDFRLDHAARLLRADTAPVAQVMEQSGFLTRSNFYREFQRRFDMSPAAYRKAGPKSRDG